MSLSCTVSEIVENRQFIPTLPLFGAPVWGDPVEFQFRQNFWHQKTKESTGYRTSLFAWSCV